jgi:hypothetical protein
LASATGADCVSVDQNGQGRNEQNIPIWMGRLVVPVDLMVVH